MTMTATMASPPATEAGAIVVHLACVGCGYNLRGLVREGACPECGAKVSESDRPDRLVYADRQWLIRMVRGLDWILASLVVGAIAWAGYVAAAMTMRPQTPVAELLLWVLAMPPAALTAYGCWLVSSPEPRAPSLSDSWIRRVARAGSVALLAMALLTGPLYFLLPPLAIMTFLCGGVSAVVGGFAALVYARGLALRISDTALAKRLWWLTRIYIGLVAAAVAGAGMLSMLAALDSGFLARNVTDVLELVVVVCFMLLLLAGLLASGVAGIWTIVLFVAMRLALAKVVRQQAD